LAVQRLGKIRIQRFENRTVVTAEKPLRFERSRKLLLRGTQQKHHLNFRMAASLNLPDEHLVQGRRNQFDGKGAQRRLKKLQIDRGGMPAILIDDAQFIKNLNQFLPHLPMAETLVGGVIFCPQCQRSSHRKRFKKLPQGLDKLFRGKQTPLLNMQISPQSKERSSGLPADGVNLSLWKTFLRVGKFPRLLAEPVGTFNAAGTTIIIKQIGLKIGQPQQIGFQKGHHIRQPKMKTHSPQRTVQQFGGRMCSKRPGLVKKIRDFQPPKGPG